MASDELATATAEDLTAAQEEPVYRHGRLVYRGRLLSIEEWLPFFERRVLLESAAEEDRAEKRLTDMRPWIAHWIAYLRAVFPSRRFRWFVPDPVALMRGLPGHGLRECYDRFFTHQARALGMTAASQVAQPTPNGSGTSDSSRSAAGASA